MHDEDFLEEIDDADEAYEELLSFINQQGFRSATCIYGLVGVLFNVCYSIDLFPQNFSLLLGEMDATYRKNFEDRNTK